MARCRPSGEGMPSHPPPRLRLHFRSNVAFPLKSRYSSSRALCAVLVTKNPFWSADQFNQVKLPSDREGILRNNWPCRERISIELSGLRAIARRLPSGEITQVGSPIAASSRSKLKRANSGPRPSIGSRIETIICLWSSLCSANTHVLDGGWAQETLPLRESLTIVSGVPPASGIRRIGKGMAGRSLSSPSGQTGTIYHLPSG